MSISTPISSKSESNKTYSNFSNFSDILNNLMEKYNNIRNDFYKRNEEYKNVFFKIILIVM